MRQPNHMCLLPTYSRIAQAAITRLTLVRSRMVWRRVWAMCLVLGLFSATLIQAATPARQLPPFRIDPNLPPDIVLNAGQGLGLCHWIDTNTLSTPYISWAYDATAAVSGWVVVEPQDGVFDWAPLDAEIAKARRLGKHVWLELLTTEGQTPQWAKNAGVVVIGSRGGTPLPWDETYQRLLRRAVHAMAARYDDDPTVDAINVMAGGCYGEMTICAASTDKKDWERAGYTDAKFIEAVKQILDIYLEEEHQWEDGSRTHGFQKTPVVLQLGAGLYGHTKEVIQPVVDYAMSTYGMRVWLKYNGFGGDYDMGWLYAQYDALTKVGYEPAGNSQDFLSHPKQYIQTALQQHASYLCLQSPYLDATDPQWQEARELAARYLGAQIVIQAVHVPDVVKVEEEYAFTTVWVNRGNAPLMRPERYGIKDVPASYGIMLAFVDVLSGSPVFEYTFTPAVPTTNWYAAQPITIEETILIPASVPAGEYDLRFALLDPNGPAEDEQSYFRLVNTNLHDGHGRYTVGRIVVLHEATPEATDTPTPSPTPSLTSTPTPTPTPSPGPGGIGDWLIRLLRAIWEWLRNLFR